MFYIDPLELDKIYRYVKDLHKDDVISDEYRGWNWSSGKLSSPSENIYLSVSEVANRYCPNYRDIYLKKIAKISSPITFRSVRGLVYHQVSAETLTLIKSYLYANGIVSGYKIVSDLVDDDKVVSKVVKNLDISKYVSTSDAKRLKKNAMSLYRYLILQSSSAVDRVIASTKYLMLDSIVNHVIPDIVEMRIDGRLIGLSPELRVDMYLGKIIADLKTGDKRPFHKYSVTGYALALEADKEIPIDYGLIIYLSVEDDLVKIDKEMYYIGDELRDEFIQIRDEVFEVIESGRDPGIPVDCPSYCVYYNVCHGK